ncbi:hypothetical protein PTTG_25768 [Puccinia triticina 1-1 BBBD Race 1]|uniref:Uncharacterized protein n=2 Tax=Puccinia triticina TaxID=208348 RepID=A0A180H096_PUCT1|nr:hypothetical protein PTTG_25768 [Puccinia triticina 1-1 BBBD Race 1]WAR59117.1 hypothetical protein PtB15_10B459 [Puccinia triticina]
MVDQRRSGGLWLPDPRVFSYVGQLHSDMFQTDAELIPGDIASDIENFLTHDVPIHEEHIGDFSELITDMVIPVTTPTEDRTAHLARLANRLAHFNKDDLQASRKAIRSYSDPLVNTLAGLYGILGPQNVLKTQLTKMVEGEAFARGLPDTFDARRFVTELIELQPQLAELAKYLRLPEDTRAQSPAPHEAVTAIKNFGEKQDAIFGSRRDFQSFVAGITELEFYKAFQTELESPNDQAGYELQLVQLPDDMQELRHIFQLPSKDKFYTHTSHVQRWASRSIAESLEIAYRASQLNKTRLSKLKDYSRNPRKFDRRVGRHR